jgi:5-methylcytosine-specific restriction endonuclease McrA
MDTAHDLADRLASLLRREQGALADFLLTLADFDRRRMWEPLGYSSLFHFLHRHLGMSKGAAHYRKTAAELIQRVPEVVEPLRAGTLCITSTIELAKVLTPENREKVLPRFLHCSRREAQAVSAELAPMEAPPHRTVITAFPAVAARPTEVQPSVLRPFTPTTLAAQVSACAPSTRVQSVELSAPTPAPRSEAQPLTADLRRLHVTVSKRFMEKLEKARDALSHAHPGADVETILEAGLDLVLDRAAKRKGLVKRPRSQASDVRLEHGDPRQIPAAVRREVFLRDDGRCRWPTAEGGICGSTHRVELDHIIPVARGGRPTVANLRILCDFHNDLAARQIFGDAFMEKFARAADARDRQPAPPR